jgi:hypothetical protein
VTIGIGARCVQNPLRPPDLLHYLILIPSTPLLLLPPDSYGTAKSGVGISAMSVLRPDLMMKCVVPVIMAGIIAVSRLLNFPVNSHCPAVLIFLQCVRLGYVTLT